MKKLISILSVLVLLGVSIMGCTATDPITDDLYVSNFYPSDTVTYDFGSPTLAWREGYFSDLFVGGVPVGTGSGDVVGPAVATDSSIVRFDGVTGKLIKDTLGVTLDDFANLTLGGDLFANDVNAGNDVNVTNDLDVTDNADVGGDLAVTGTSTFDSPVNLTGTGRVYIELRPDLDFETVRAFGKPDWVLRGVIGGFSLPIYAADNEELYLECHIPYRWDNISDILVHVHCYIDTANAAKNFQIQLAWEHFTDGDIIPATSNPVVVETATGAGVQFQSYHVAFTIDYDIDVGDPIISTDEMHMRVRRIAATVGEIAGEIVVTHVGVVYLTDKLGVAAP